MSSTASTTASSRPRRSTSSARSRPSSSGPCCCSPAARTRSSCCTLAEKAFWPARPVPGHARRHRAQLRRGPRVPRPHGRPSSASALVVGSRPGRHRRRAGSPRRPGPRACRNRLQTVTLLDAIKEHRFDAVFGGGRRDEEKARAKERVFCFRDEFGQWDPKNQRPELWSLYNGRHRKGEHIRVFPSATGPSSTSGSTSPTRRSSSRRSTSRTAGRCSGATGCCWRSPPRRAARRRGAVEAHRALPHRRRRDVHRLRSSRPPPRSTT